MELQLINCKNLQLCIEATQAPSSFANLLSLSHLPTRKTRGKELLVDYNQSHIITSIEYLRFMEGSTKKGKQKKLDIKSEKGG